VLEASTALLEAGGEVDVGSSDGGFSAVSIFCSYGRYSIAVFQDQCLLEISLSVSINLPIVEPQTRNVECCPGESDLAFIDQLSRLLRQLQLGAENKKSGLKYYIRCHQYQSQE